MPSENLNLVSVVCVIEKQISELNSEYVKRIMPCEESLAKLREINTVCEICCGIGEVFRRLCAEDGGDYYACPDCKGSDKYADHV